MGTNELWEPMIPKEQHELREHWELKESGTPWEPMIPENDMNSGNHGNPRNHAGTPWEPMIPKEPHELREPWEPWIPGE